jgi:hypothetical protein
VVGKCVLPENPTLGRRLGVEPFYPWDGFPAHPKEAMMIIKRMKLTGAAILVSRGMKVLQAVPAAYPYRFAGLVAPNLLDSGYREKLPA